MKIPLRTIWKWSLWLGLPPYHWCPSQSSRFHTGWTLMEGRRPSKSELFTAPLVFWKGKSQKRGDWEAGGGKQFCLFQVKTHFSTTTLKTCFLFLRLQRRVMHWAALQPLLRLAGPQRKQELTVNGDFLLRSQRPLLLLQKDIGRQSDSRENQERKPRLLLWTMEFPPLNKLNKHQWHLQPLLKSPPWPPPPQQLSSWVQFSYLLREQKHNSPGRRGGKQHCLLDNNEPCGASIAG